MTAKEEQRPPWDVYFMLQAEIAKLRSNCLTRQVGAVIVKDKRQIATGYNGTPSGVRNCFDGGCQRCMERKNGTVQAGTGLDRCLCNHAESNAILQCAVMGNSSKGSVLYCTLVPCLDCSKMIVTSGITRVVAVESTYPENARELFIEAGVQFETIKPSALEQWRGKW